MSTIYCVVHFLLIGWNSLEYKESTYLFADSVWKWIYLFLCSPSDKSAAENLGRVLAQRCFEAGITCMVEMPLDGAAETEGKGKVSQSSMTMVRKV